MKKFVKKITGEGNIYLVVGEEYKIRIRKPFGYNTWRVETSKILKDVYGEKRVWNEITNFHYLKDAKEYVNLNM